MKLFVTMLAVLLSVKGAHSALSEGSGLDTFDQIIELQTATVKLNNWSVYKAVANYLLLAPTTLGLELEGEPVCIVYYQFLPKKVFFYRYNTNYKTLYEADGKLAPDELLEVSPMKWVMETTEGSEEIVNIVFTFNTYKSPPNATEYIRNYLAACGD